MLMPKFEKQFVFYSLQTAKTTYYDFTFILVNSILKVGVRKQAVGRLLFLYKFEPLETVPQSYVNSNKDIESSLLLFNILFLHGQILKLSVTGFSFGSDLWPWWYVINCRCTKF